MENCETSIDQGPATICVCTVGSLGDSMEPANQIRIALAKVTGLRTDAREDPRLDESVRWVKQFQTKRFESTYSDLIADGPYRGATRFFLDELYGEVSYAERDAQFSKIAGAKSPSVTGPHDSYSPIDRHNVQGGCLQSPFGLPPTPHCTFNSGSNPVSFAAIFAHFSTAVHSAQASRRPGATAPRTS